MTDKEDFIVQEPYQPTEEERQAIKELEDKEQGLVAEDWDSQKTSIKSFKKNLRNDMYKKQNKLCAFCRIHVPSACVPMHREHIVYKNKHPQWTFLPENLCVACPSCNEYKGTTEVLVDPQTSTYPNVGNGFKIIHPLYDRYSDHIELLGGVLYRGKTDKGVFTIEKCHLHRVGLAEERADQKMYTENKGSIIAELIHLTTISNHYVDDQDDFIRYVMDIVEGYKLKQVKDNV
jgi:uncharacterized protein (TIGR02646 family)